MKGVGLIEKINSSKSMFFELFLNSQIVTSAVTVEEYLVFPYSSGKLELVDNFKNEV